MSGFSSGIDGFIGALNQYKAIDLQQRAQGQQAWQENQLLPSQIRLRNAEADNAEAQAKYHNALVNTVGKDKGKLTKSDESEIFEQNGRRYKQNYNYWYDEGGNLIKKDPIGMPEEVRDPAPTRIKSIERNLLTGKYEEIEKEWDGQKYNVVNQQKPPSLIFGNGRDTLNVDPWNNTADVVFSSSPKKDVEVTQKPVTLPDGSSYMGQYENGSLVGYVDTETGRVNRFAASASDTFLPQSNSQSEPFLDLNSFLRGSPAQAAPNGLADNLFGDTTSSGIPDRVKTPPKTSDKTDKPDLPKSEEWDAIQKNTLGRIQGAQSAQANDRWFNWIRSTFGGYDIDKPYAEAALYGAIDDALHTAGLGGDKIYGKQEEEMRSKIINKVMGEYKMANAQTANWWMPFGEKGTEYYPVNEKNIQDLVSLPAGRRTLSVPLNTSLVPKEVLDVEPYDGKPISLSSTRFGFDLQKAFENDPRGAEELAKEWYIATALDKRDEKNGTKNRNFVVQQVRDRFASKTQQEQTALQRAIRDPNAVNSYQPASQSVQELVTNGKGTQFLKPRMKTAASTFLLPLTRQPLFPY